MATRLFNGRVQVLTMGPGEGAMSSAKRARWIWRDWICPVGEIHLSEREKEFAARIRGQGDARARAQGGGEPQQGLGRECAGELARRLTRRATLVRSSAEPGEPSLPGVEATVTAHQPRSLRGAGAGPPGGSARRRAAPCGGGAWHTEIVIFGGFISPRQTGYLHQVNLFTGGPPCGLRERLRSLRAGDAPHLVRRSTCTAQMLDADSADTAI